MMFGVLKTGMNPLVACNFRQAVVQKGLSNRLIGYRSHSNVTSSDNDNSNPPRIEKQVEIQRLRNRRDPLSLHQELSITMLDQAGSARLLENRFNVSGTQVRDHFIGVAKCINNQLAKGIASPKSITDPCWHSDIGSVATPAHNLVDSIAKTGNTSDEDSIGLKRDNFKSTLSPDRLDLQVDNDKPLLELKNKIEHEQKPIQKDGKMDFNAIAEDILKEKLRIEKDKQEKKDKAKRNRQQRLQLGIGMPPIAETTRNTIFLRELVLNTKEQERKTILAEVVQEHQFKKQALENSRKGIRNTRWNCPWLAQYDVFLKSTVNITLNNSLEKSRATAAASIYAKKTSKNSWKGKALLEKQLFTPLFWKHVREGVNQLISKEVSKKKLSIVASNIGGTDSTNSKDPNTPGDEAPKVTIAQCKSQWYAMEQKIETDKIYKEKKQERYNTNEVIYRILEPKKA